MASGKAEKRKREAEKRAYPNRVRAASARSRPARQAHPPRRLRLQVACGLTNIRARRGERKKEGECERTQWAFAAQGEACGCGAYFTLRGPDGPWAEADGRCPNPPLGVLAVLV